MPDAQPDIPYRYATLPIMLDSDAQIREQTRALRAVCAWRAQRGLDLRLYAQWAERNEEFLGARAPMRPDGVPGSRPRTW